MIIDTTDEYSDTALAPGPSQPKKRKVVKTPACIDMTEDEQYSYLSFIYLFFISFPDLWLEQMEKKINQLVEIVNINRSINDKFIWMFKSMEKQVRKMEDVICQQRECYDFKQL